jgi:SM-20-related protein
MLNISRISGATMAVDPYPWTGIDDIFCREHAEGLESSLPRTGFKPFVAYDGEKAYAYQARPLISLGAASPTDAGELSTEWRTLLMEVLSPDYRSAMSQLTGLDLSTARLEANLTAYGPGHFQGPHVDREQKLVTHVIYLSQNWLPTDGGSLLILRSNDPNDIASTIAPRAGNSVVLARSRSSWHMVQRVQAEKRRALNVVFHRSGSIDGLWPHNPRSGLLRRLRRWIPLR